jgi:CubicO group peptidase (beta-lactamase class C family)
MNRIAAIVLFALSVSPALAQQLPGVAEAVDRHIQKKEMPGAVTAVVRPDGMVHLHAQGLADVERNVAMKPDAIFWIASMSKPVTGTALMMLIEEGKVGLDDPVTRFIPELKGLKLADGTTPTITIRHLMTHTSGLGEISGQEANTCVTLADAVALYAKKPLKFPPGSKWQYCQSSINTGARVVEVVSGKPFDAFLQERLFGPLGMKDTTFYLTDAQLPRLAISYKKDKETLAPTPIGFLNGKAPTSKDRFPAGNGGLFSTAPDYARFCQMILNGGTLDGKAYLKPESIKTMSSVLSGEVQTGFTPGNGWGLGWCVVRQPQGVSAMLSPGTFGHGGAYGTQAWIDPERKVAYVLMVQRSNFPNSDASDLRKDFQSAAAGAVK